MTFEYFAPSLEDTRVAADTQRRAAAVREWLGKACSYSPRELPDHIRPPSNALLSHMERVLFVTDTDYRSRERSGYPAYMSKGQTLVTTWTGETLATVTRLRNGAFRAFGIDGRRYYGRSNGGGMHCRMRLSKGQVQS